MKVMMAHMCPAAKMAVADGNECSYFRLTFGTGSEGNFHACSRMLFRLLIMLAVHGYSE